MFDMPYIPTKQNPVYLIYMYKKLKTTYNGWYAIKANQTVSFIFNIYV